MFGRLESILLDATKKETKILFIRLLMKRRFACLFHKLFLYMAGSYLDYLAPGYLNIVDQKCMTPLYADEVQVGFARSGIHFGGFGVRGGVPEIVIII